MDADTRKACAAIDWRDKSIDAGEIVKELTSKK
jgi:hypothetical protein